MRVLRSSWDYIWRGTIVDRLGEWLLGIAGVTVVVVMAVMTVYIISRKLNVPFPGAFLFSQESMMILLAFPLAAVAVRKGHIQFELVFKRFALKTQERLELITHIVGIFLFGTVAWYAWVGSLMSLAMREYDASGAIEFPIYPFKIALAIGLSVFTLQLLVLLLRGVVRQLRGTS